MAERVVPPSDSQRPLSPRLSVYRWHMTMIASLAHRGSGMVLVAFMVFYFFMLSLMMGTPEQFEYSVSILHSGFGRLLLLGGSVALVYHLINGVRFLLLDAGFGESRQAMRFSARLVLAVTALAALLIGWSLL